MTEANELALNGGPKTKTTPYGTGKRFLDNEIKYLQEALEQNTLFYGFGEQVKKACAMMVEYTGMPYVVSCSSGSAAVHLGLIAGGIGAGDEVICTPNTDSGSILGIIEEGAVPVFCDCEDTLQPSARTVAAKITEHTKAVVVVHLAGYPAPVDEIVALCEPKGIAVVEDCAQSWGTKLNGQLVGSFGTAGCYSTNDFKHISTGDGGFVALRDEELYRRVSNYSDKHYDRLFDRAQAQAHHGINYRMSEVQGAVAIAQLEKVDSITSRQHDIGEGILAGLEGLPGATMVSSIPGGYSTYWWSVLRLDPEAVTVPREKLIEAVQAEGVSFGNYEKYDLIQKPLFQTRQVRPWLEGDRALYPLVQPDGRSYTYTYEDTPIHKRLLETGMMVPISTWYTDQDVEETVAGIRKVFDVYSK
ncbi:MAG: DegT/DnrJ/EryC1/StrS family aminotransferase [Planctomycetota bacterium]|jgi:dTDP-4-amino-4,6-dideoxygalactose transaminase